MTNPSRSADFDDSLGFAQRSEDMFVDIATYVLLLNPDPRAPAKIAISCSSVNRCEVWSNFLAKLHRVMDQLLKDMQMLTTRLIVSIMGLLTMFAAISFAVVSGSTSAFDRYLILSLRKQNSTSVLLGPEWLPETARNLTSLGSVPVLVILVAITVGCFLIANRSTAIRGIVIAFVGGLMMLNLLKWGFARPRPDFIVPVGEVFTDSFPSGHATLSAATYLTLAMILSRAANDWRFTVFFFGISLSIMVMIGISRVYLGLHYPSDVLAGWCLGSAWALCCGAMLDQVRPS